MRKQNQENDKSVTVNGFPGVTQIARKIAKVLSEKMMGNGGNRDFSKLTALVEERKFGKAAKEARKYGDPLDKSNALLHVAIWGFRNGMGKTEAHGLLGESLQAAEEFAPNCICRANALANIAINGFKSGILELAEAEGMIQTAISHYSASDGEIRPCNWVDLMLEIMGDAHEASMPSAVSMAADAAKKAAMDTQTCDRFAFESASPEADAISHLLDVIKKQASLGLCSEAVKTAEEAEKLLEKLSPGERHLLNFKDFSDMKQELVEKAVEQKKNELDGQVAGKIKQLLDENKFTDAAELAKQISDADTKFDMLFAIAGKSAENKSNEEETARIFNDAISQAAHPSIPVFIKGVNLIRAARLGLKYGILDGNGTGAILGRLPEIYAQSTGEDANPLMWVSLSATALSSCHEKLPEAAIAKLVWLGMDASGKAANYENGGALPNYALGAGVFHQFGTELWKIGNADAANAFKKGMDLAAELDHNDFSNVDLLAKLHTGWQMAMDGVPYELYASVFGG